MPRQQMHDNTDLAQQVATAAVAPPLSCSCMGGITHAAETRLHGGGSVAAASPKAMGDTWRQSRPASTTAIATATATIARAATGASLLSLPSELLVVISSALEDKAAMRSACRNLRDILNSSLTSLQWRRESELHELPSELLAKLPSVRRIGFSGRPGRPPVLVRDLSPLSALTTLQQLDFSHSRVADLAPLTALTALQELNCSGAGALDLTPLGGLTRLTSLNFCASGITSLAPLSALTALRILNCMGTAVDDLSPLAALTSLCSLNCIDTPVPHLSHLTALSALESLYCCGCRDVADLSPLAPLTAMRTLCCRHTSVSDLSPLSALTELRTLDCSYTHVASVAALAALAELRALTCRATWIQDLAPLAALTALRSMDCRSYRGTEPNLGVLSGLTALRIMS